MLNLMRNKGTKRAKFVCVCVCVCVCVFYTAKQII